MLCSHHDAQFLVFGQWCLHKSVSFTHLNFGTDINAEDLDADPVDLLLLEGNQPSSHHPPSPPEASPPRPKVEIKPQAPASLSEKFRSRRERVGKGQLLDDPAVMRTVEGPPSLKVWLGSGQFSIMITHTKWWDTTWEGGPLLSWHNAQN